MKAAKRSPRTRRVKETVPENVWISVTKQLPDDYERVDVWLHITPSIFSMGFGDAWREVEVWRERGKWFHLNKMEDGKKMELYSHYITHWRKMPDGPNAREQTMEDLVSKISDANLNRADGWDG